MENKLIEIDNQFYLQTGDTQVFLCGLAPESVSEIQKPSDVAITKLAALDEVVKMMAQGLCPLCHEESRLVVKSIGRYRCDSCGTSFVNDRGLRLPTLFVDELILGVARGKSVVEMTTTSAIPGIPKGLGKVVKPSLDYSKVCPKCYETLNLRGECAKCGWMPTDRDKLWEKVIRIVERVVELGSVGEGVLEFELHGELCKIYLEDIGDGLRFKARLKNVHRDTLHEVIGRPRRIINCVLDWTNVEPALSTVLASTPLSERVSAGPAKSVLIQVGTEDEQQSLDNFIEEETGHGAGNTEPE